MTRLLGRLKRMPFSPAVNKSDPIEAACPTTSVLTLGRIYCIVS